MGNIYKFTVSGGGFFPIDMLRFDECWPANPSDSYKIEEARETRTVDLFTHRRHITLKRWESFCWEVVETDPDMEGETITREGAQQ